MSAFATAIWNTLSKHQIFTLNFVFKLFHVFIAIDNCRSQKYHLQFLNNYAYHEPAKFDQNRMVRTLQNFELFYKKPFHMLNILTYR